ncbi:MAG: nuclease-related domain-containing protein [Rhodoferax sp.]|nr:nuclease-related domain-containing protein [Rhodoferax sp.]
MGPRAVLTLQTTQPRGCIPIFCYGCRNRWWLLFFFPLVPKQVQRLAGRVAYLLGLNVKRRKAIRNLTTFLYILIAAVVGYVFGRYRAHSFQNRGEALLARTIRNHFASPDYHLMNNVTLPLKDGTTQVDHILVSRFGVFVIETKDYNGWIFANPKHATWTQTIFKSKFKFQNPIFQNYRHLRAVQSLLDFLPPEAVKSAIVFTGEAEFKTEIPDGVFTLPRFIESVRSQTTSLLSQNRVQFCVGRLETSRLALTRKTDIEHVQSLQRRHGGEA